jgi:predicted membrane protein
MVNRSAFWIGGILVLIGLIFLAGNIFNFNAWAFCWPAVLIVLGVWVLLRPRLALPGTNVDFHFIGDINRSGAFTLVPEDLSTFIGDIDYDLSQATIQPGETRLQMTGFIGDVDIYVPAGVGFRVVCNGFVSEVKLFGQKRSSFLTPVDFASSNFATAERKIFLEMSWFIGDITIKGG